MTMHKSDLSQRAQDKCKRDTKATHERRFRERFFLVLWHLVRTCSIVPVRA